MAYKLICCEVFSREIYKELLESNNSVFPVFTQKLSHVHPESLRDLIQREIDKTESEIFNYILLGYGLCGNAINGIQAKNIPLVIPRAHDCCTILLGSKEAYKMHFAHRASCRWTSGGYMELGDTRLKENESSVFYDLNINYLDLVEKYGEDNAAYIIDSLTPKDGSNEQMIFIQTPPYKKLGSKDKAEKAATSKGCEFELIEGNVRLLHMLINGIWPEEEFLVVPPRYHVEGVYDHNQVIKAVL